ncbi:hypothetical protein ACJIZ3_025798 [Penstemon smallii]|uniref:Bromo domain-containing protein n=1 Tax=Penstemon smallii TaxID=265156 RepID=A0ABD3TYB5_9LAMI
MTKPDGTAPEAPNDDVTPSWGTWEELLLAFAVNRHGTAAWDSIAAELQKQNPDRTLPLTAENCRLKYVDLKCRFAARNDAVLGDNLNDDDSIPLLDELRKLRMVELRREVQRYDLKIESLELKMKKMEEEKERGSTREKSVVDPEKKNEGSEKNQMSVNESNSTDLRAEKLRTGVKETKPIGTGPATREPMELKSEPDGKSVQEDSFNGSSNSIEKELDQEAKVEPVSGSAESKGEGEEPTEENSDVQSSASRSVKDDDGSDKVRRGSTSGGERGHVDESRTIKELSTESRPFMDFLQVMRSHKLGSMFERRLRSQESPKFHKLIHQHIDLQTIDGRLKEDWYSGSSRTKFFRDLSLLVNNALTFFSKHSSEFKAATEIQQLISKEMSHKYTKSDSSSGKQISLQSLSNTKKEEPEPSNSLLLKPRISGSLIVCRKRSSIAAKASDKKKEKTAALSEEPSSNAEEPKITKKRTRERFSSVSDNSKKNSKNHPNTNKNSVVESKAENKKNQSTVDSKKRGAANFLNRMKQGSSSNNGVLVDALKNTPLTSESAKKNDNMKRGEKKEHVTRRSLETRQAKEKGSPGKKNIGRPPKRGAAPPPVAGKRGRERGEAESGGSKQPKKRSRKL